MTADIRFVDRRDSDSEKWRKYSDSVIPAWVADMDFAAAEPIMLALRERLEHGVFGYSAAGEDLPEIIAEYFSRRWGWRIEADWLVYSPGLGAALHNTCRMIAPSTPGILTPQPIYHVFRQAPALAKRRRADVPMEFADGEWHLPLATLEAKAKGAGLMQLCNPHNPNGKIFRRDELEEIAEFCLRRNLLICADEVHADLILDADKKHIPIASLSPEVAARTITLQSPSKAFNIAGLNFAVAIIPNADLRARYRAAARGTVLSNLNPFGYVAAAAAWSGDCDDWLNSALALLRANRDSLANAIAGMDGVDMPPLSSTYLAWLNIEKLRLPNPQAHFLQHGIGMSPGGDFGDENYMRLNFGCSPARLDDIITRLRQAAF